MKRINFRELLCSSAITVLLTTSSFAIAPAFAQEVACEPPVTVDRAPPPLPVYSQPPVPAPGYIWTPGYWAWDDGQNDYYWTPGTWVEPPRPGLLWTPGYWGWVGGIYLFHRGYWGPQVGFYGGINYGYGYAGDGYQGGRWDNGTFFYNRTVNNISNTSITNVYDKTIIVNREVTNASFNGGHGGIDARPTPGQKAYAREAHFAPTRVQAHHAAAARNDRALFLSENRGKPPIAAVGRPGKLEGGAAPVERGEHKLHEGEPTVNGTERPKMAPHGGEKPLEDAHPSASDHKAERNEHRRGAHSAAVHGEAHPALRPAAHKPKAAFQHPHAAPHVPAARPPHEAPRPSPQARPAPHPNRPLPRPVPHGPKPGHKGEHQ
jgi:WXXGXW repeat (2 copies)